MHGMLAQGACASPNTTSAARSTTNTSKDKASDGVLLDHSKHKQGCERRHTGEEEDEGEAEEDEDESAFLHSKKRPTPEDGEEVQPSLAQKRRHRPKLVIPDSSEDEKSKASEEPPKREPWVKPPGGR